MVEICLISYFAQVKPEPMFVTGLLQRNIQKTVQMMLLLGAGSAVYF